MALRVSLTMNLFRREGVRLAGLLGAAALLAVLIHSDGAIPTGAIRAPGERTTMPDVVARTLDGHAWRLSDHRGKVVLLNYWASWCPPCREETPGLAWAFEFYGSRGFLVAAMSMDDSTEPVRQFVSQFHVTYPILLPASEDGLTSSIDSLPTSFLLDRKGLVAKTYTGVIPEHDIAQDIERLLAEQ